MNIDLEKTVKQYIREILWHRTEKEDYPVPYGKYKETIYPEIPCLCKVSKFGDYHLLHWNPTDDCWDDEEADDYYCDPNGVSEWAYLDDLLGIER